MKREISPLFTMALAVSLIGLAVAVADPSVTGLFHKDTEQFADLVCNKRGLCPTSFASGASQFACVDIGPVKVAESCVPDSTPDPGATACYDYPGGAGTTAHACSSATVTYVCDDTGFYEIRKSNCDNTVCSDSDGGVVVHEKGIVIAPSRSLPFVGAYMSAATTEYKDHCVGDGGVAVETSRILREYFCSQGGVSFVDYDCAADGGYCKDPPGGPDKCTALAQGQVPPPVPCAGILNPCSTSADCPQGQTCLNCQCFYAPPPSLFNAIWGYPVSDQNCVAGEVTTLYGQTRVCTVSGLWEVVNPVPLATESFFDVFTTVQPPNEAQTFANAIVTPTAAQPCGASTQCAGLLPGTSAEAVQRCRQFYPQSPVPLGCNSQCQCAPTQG